MKRLFCLILIFLLCTDGIAAIVSDNDGAAFITKAEFEAMKSNFRTQINEYSHSIDGKIEGAIASYLAGLQIDREETVENLSRAYAPGVLMVNKSFLDNYLKYKYGRCDLTARFIASRYWNNSGFYSEMGYETPNDNVGNNSYNVIKSIYNKGTNQYGVWEGYNRGVKLKINSAQSTIVYLGSPASQAYLGGFRWSSNGYYEDLNVPLFQAAISASSQNDEVALGQETNYSFAKNSLTVSYDNNLWDYKNICIIDDGNYNGEFHLYNNVNYLLNDASRTENRVEYRSKLTFKSYNYKDTDSSITSGKQPTASTYNQNLYGGPALGFVTSITKWNQLVTEKILYDGENLSLINGIPIVELNGNQSCRFNVNFDDNTNDYYIYLKVDKFNGEPIESECETIILNTNGTEEVGKTTIAKNGSGIITFENDDSKKGTVFLKWRKVNKSSNDNDGMLLIDGNSNVIITTR